MNRRWGIVFIVLVLCGGVWAQPVAPDKPPLPVNARFLVLDKTFTDFPVLWSDEPYAPVGEWLNALGIRWTVQENTLRLEPPLREVLIWKTDTAELQVGGRKVKVLPLLSADDKVWLPLFSFAQVLGLKAWANTEKQQVHLTSPMQSVQLKPLPIGWLMEVTFGYPLPSTPRLGTLVNPYRAYADFSGTSLEMPSGNMAEIDDTVTALRVGQFSATPPIARIVADSKVPVTISVVGRERGEGKSQRWKLLLQPTENRSLWMGQITITENAPLRATLLMRGFLSDSLQVKHEPKQVVLEIPVQPLMPFEPFPATDDGLLQSVTTEVSEGGIKVRLMLSRSARAHWRPEGSDAVTLVIEAERPDTATRVRLIIVDAGHGGHDPGASSPLGFGKPQLIEKQLTLDIALRLKRMLEQAGHRVLMTRETDVYVPLPDRVAFANSAKADAFVSVHLNAFPKPGGQWGTEVYYWTPQSLPLAESIYRHLLALLGRKGNGVRRRQLYVVHHTTMPSALVESCYLNHPEEEELLRNERFRERIALAIFRGLLEFFGDRQTLERKGE